MLEICLYLGDRLFYSPQMLLTSLSKSSVSLPLLILVCNLCEIYS